MHNARAELISYLEANIADPSQAPALADKIMSSDRFNENDIKGEIPGAYTVSGNPIPFSL